MNRERTLILHADEIRELQRTGVVTIQRAVKVPPGRLVRAGTKGVVPLMPGGCCRVSVCDLVPPFPVGTRVAVKEELTLWPGHAEYTADLSGLSWVRESVELYEWLDTYPHATCPANRMPLWAVRFRPIVASVRVVNGERWMFESTLKLEPTKGAEL